MLYYIRVLPGPDRVEKFEIRSVRCCMDSIFVRAVSIEFYGFARSRLRRRYYYALHNGDFEIGVCTTERNDSNETVYYRRAFSRRV